MKHKFLALGVALSVALSACGGTAPAAAPTLDSANVAATAQAAAFTMIAETQASIPTETTLPPTATFTATPLPTETATLEPTIDPLLPTATFTLAPQAAGPTKDPCNKILSSWSVPTTKIQVTNETNAKASDIILSLYVTTSQGECGFIPATTGGSFSGPAGYYSAYAYVNGPKQFRTSGGFALNGGSWKIIIRKDTIVAKGGCYPNC